MEHSSILPIAQLFGRTVQDIILRSCKLKVKLSKTAQFIPSLQLNEEIGAFVAFYGNYNGLMVMNFQGGAALEIVRASLLNMGMSEAEVPTHHTSEDVRNGIGEVVNHIVGMARIVVQNKYDLSADAHIPGVVSLCQPIGLTFESKLGREDPCVRLSFTTPAQHRFQLELTMEASRLTLLNAG